MHHALIDSTSNAETQEAKFVPVLRGIQFIDPVYCPGLYVLRAECVASQPLIFNRIKEQKHSSEKFARLIQAKRHI